jgi:hypothetical protein
MKLQDAILIASFFFAFFVFLNQVFHVRRIHSIRPVVEDKEKIMNRKDAYLARARRGSVTDVRFLMNQLDSDQDLVTIKLVDMVLDYVASAHGLEEIERYLISGTEMQRNYVANFYRRRGDREMLLIAWEMNAIDSIQAFVR